MASYIGRYSLAFPQRLVGPRCYYPSTRQALLGFAKGACQHRGVAECTHSGDPINASTVSRSRAFQLGLPIRFSGPFTLTNSLAS